MAGLLALCPDPCTVQGSGRTLRLCIFIQQFEKPFLILPVSYATDEWPVCDLKKKGMMRRYFFPE